MAVMACLNGARSRAEHPVVPLSPAELAADAIAVRAAGAFAVHVHPTDRHGVPTLDAKACDAAVAAIRAAVPRLPIGVSTSAAINPDPFARAAALAAWRQRPDFVSMNLSDLGWTGIARAALHAGIAIEAGLAVAADAEELRRSPFAHQILRALVEVDDGAEDARALAELIPPGRGATLARFRSADLGGHLSGRGGRRRRPRRTRRRAGASRRQHRGRQRRTRRRSRAVDQRPKLRDTQRQNETRRSQGARRSRRNRPIAYAERSELSGVATEVTGPGAWFPADWHVALVSRNDRAASLSPAQREVRPCAQVCYLLGGDCGSLRLPSRRSEISVGLPLGDANPDQAVVERDVARAAP